MAGFTRALSLYLITSGSLLTLILTMSERGGSLTPLEEARREVEFLLFN